MPERTIALDPLLFVLERAPVMLAHFDASLRCTFANSSFCDFHGIPPARITGMSLADIGGADVHGAPTAEAQLGLGPITRCERRTASGRPRYIEVRRTFETAPDGSFAGLTCALLDITEEVQRDLADRERAESKIRASESRLRAILDSEPECVKVLAPDATLLEINRAGLAMLEAQSIGEVRAHGLVNFVLAEHRERFMQCFAVALNGGESMVEFEIAGLRGTRRWLESHATRIALPDERHAGVLAVTRDVSERRHAQERIAFLSQNDTLTGLPNRDVFRDRLEVAVTRARRRGEGLAAVVIGLDDFAKFNESLGTRMGDELLRAVGRRLHAALEEEVDTVARVGGDTFAVLIEEIGAPGEVLPVAERISAELSAPFDLLGRELYVSASAGIASYPGAGGSGTAATLLENAAAAMARVKREGGGGYQFYEEQPSARRGGRLEIESELRRALEAGELAVHYQPKVDMRSGQPTGAEALLRWRNARLGPIGPAQFIPVAEESGLILPIGQWVLATACAQASAWRRGGRPLSIAVNLSPRQFRQTSLVRHVADAIAANGLPPGALELEITEGTAMANADRAAAILDALHGLGARLAVDDFGTGYTSLGQLQRFALNTLKIDRAFVRDITKSAGDQAIVRAMIALAHSLKLSVVAEGVETREQHTLLANMGCDEGQGYFYGAAVPANELGALLERSPWRASEATRQRVRGARRSR